MADINRMIRITREDFGRLKEDIRLLEEAYFSAPYNDYKSSARIDYNETIRLVKLARALHRLNIRLSRLYEDFRAFMGKEGIMIPAHTGSMNMGFADSDAVSFHLDGDDVPSYKDVPVTPEPPYPVSDMDSYVPSNMDSYTDSYTPSDMAPPINSSSSFHIDNAAGNAEFYNDFIFGLRREIPLAISPHIDLHAKSANINITKDLFKKIIVEILDYEKNYNRSIFSSGALYDVLRGDVINNGRERLLPYVITNVLTYLRDSNFIGYYGADRDSSFTVLDRDGLKLWANSIL